MKSYETFDGISYGMPYGPMTWNPLEYHHMKYVCISFKNQKKNQNSLPPTNLLGAIHGLNQIVLNLGQCGGGEHIYICMRTMVLCPMSCHVMSCHVMSCHVCMYVCMYLCIFVCGYPCMCACLVVCLSACMCTIVLCSSLGGCIEETS